MENNTEHWNALLLSLRELIEWVIRKDTELTGLGPIRGDLSTLVKQQVRQSPSLVRESPAYFISVIFDVFSYFFPPALASNPLTHRHHALVRFRMISERSADSWMINDR